MNRPIRVLVVDDTSHVRRMLTTMLSVDGFEIAGEAGDGQTAIATANRTNPDVVVIDYKMPGMDGLETARILKNDSPDRHVIIYTAFMDPELEDEAAEIGIAVCVGKVEGLTALEGEIRRLCGA